MSNRTRLMKLEEDRKVWGVWLILVTVMWHVVK